MKAYLNGLLWSTTIPEVTCSPTSTSRGTVYRCAAPPRPSGWSLAIMRLSPYIIIAFGLITCVADAQEMHVRKPPFLRCIPLYIDRPVQPTGSSGTTTETIITIGAPNDSYYFVRSDIRSTNLWITADKLEYHHSSIVITDETITTIGTPSDPFYVVQMETVAYVKKQEHIIFPNRTYVLAESSLLSTNGVMAENNFKATKYCYGIRRGTPLTKTQYERLKTWLGID